MADAYQREAGSCCLTEIATGEHPDTIADGFRGAQALADGEVVDRLSPGLRAELSRLLPELGNTSATPPVSADNSTRLFEAVLELVGGMAERQPLVLVGNITSISSGVVAAPATMLLLGSGVVGLAVFLWSRRHLR